MRHCKAGASSSLPHVVFGDSSVGETYVDAACLLAGGLLAFRLADTVAVAIINKGGYAGGDLDL